MTNNKQSKRNDQLACWIDAISERYPKPYLYSLVSMMLLGYAVFLLFPYLALEGAAVLFREIPNAQTIEQWVVVGGWLAIFLFNLFLSVQVFRLPFPQVSGLKLSKGLAPDLYRLIAEVREDIPKPSINTIVLTDQFELRVEKAPVFGFPFVTTNTLVIGMPMLQTLSEDEFRYQLIRRVGQYSRGQLQPGHWLFRSRRLWRQYLDTLNENKRLLEAPLRLFLSFYAPLFEVLTLPAARMDELAADEAALEWLNDEDYFVAIKSCAIADNFLRSHYWTKVYQSAAKSPKAIAKPFEKLDNISEYFSSQDLRRKWLCAAVVEKQNPSKDTPVFSVRMENIGQSVLGDAPAVVGKTAAMKCLGAARKDFVSIMDKHWISTTFAQWKVNYVERCTDLNTVKGLNKKSARQMLSLKEVLLYARLVKKLRGDSLWGSVEKLFKRNLETFLPSLPLWNLFHRKVKSIQGDDI